MSGRGHVVAAAALVAAAFTTCSAPAQYPVDGAGGCAILATLVYTEVIEAGFRRSLPSGEPVFSGASETTICDRTTRTVTAAFTSSLRAMNTHVSWGLEWRSGGDHCQGQFLLQCHPVRDPHMPPPSTAEFGFIADSWSAVSDAIGGTMATAPSADVSVFSEARLRFSIRSRLAAHRVVGEAANIHYSR